MGQQTGIAWTDHTFNPWWGCQRVSPGCENCYAETWDTRFGGKHWGPKAERRFFGEKHWNEPRKWNAAAEKAGRRARVFCASMADVFEDRRDLDAQRERLWKLIADTPRLDWQVLTKRPENIRRLLPSEWDEKNVWLGTSVEDQRRADDRIVALLHAPAEIRFLSCEPLLEPVDLRVCRSAGDDFLPGGALHWVIVGGESGHGARPMHEEWARSILVQCKEAGVACFVKQLGGVHDKQDDPSRWPADLRVRDFPTPLEASNASGGAAAPQSQIPGSSGEKERP